MKCLSRLADSHLDQILLVVHRKDDFTDHMTLCEAPGRRDAPSAGRVSAIQADEAPAADQAHRSHSTVKAER